MAIYNRCFACLFYLVLLISPVAKASLYSQNWITERSIKASKIYAKGSYSDSYGTIVQKSTSFEIEDAKSQIISTIRSRILLNTSKGGQWSQTSIDDVLRELQAQKYIIDYDRKKIFKREIQTDGDGCFLKNTTGDIVNFTHATINNQLYSCPKPAAIATALIVMQQNSGIKNMTFVEFENIPNNTEYSRARFTYVDTGGVTRNYYIQLSTPKRSDQTDNSNEIEITPEQMWGIISLFQKAVLDSFLAGNDFEKTSNTAYMYLIDMLLGGNTDSNDSTIKPNPIDPTKPYDPTTNPSNGSFSLPSFCDYASVVCNFFRWFQKDPDSATDENVNIKDTDSNQYNQYWTEYFAVTAMCPRPHIIDFIIDLKVTQQRFYYEFEYTQMCSYAQQLRPFFLFGAYVACAMIVAGVRNG